MVRTREAMTVIKIASSVAVLVTFAVCGCASVPSKAGFDDVERAVSDRAGKRVHWNRGTAADRQVSEVVASMLRKELTADEAVQIALLNNRELQATYEDLMVAQADLVEAGLLSNPVFDVQARFLDDGTSIEAEVLQSFLEIFYLPLRKRVAAAQFEATKLRVAGAVLDVAGETRSAYYELQGAQQGLEMRRQVLVATEASFDIAQRLRRAGNITDLELFNERSLYEQSKVNVAAVEAQVLQRRERLNELMGLWGPQTEWRVAQRLPEPSQEDLAAEGLERRAIERSLDLGVARLEIQAAARTLGIVHPFAAVPSLNVGVSAEREPGTGDWGFGPALSVPIPLFNQGQPAIARAMAELRRAQRSYTGAAVTVRARVRAARNAVASARSRAEYYRGVILPVRQQIVEQTQLQYNAMQVGPIELLVAKQHQIDAAAEYINTLEEYWLAKSELDQILAGRVAWVDRREPAAARAAAGTAGAGIKQGSNQPGH